MNPALRLPSLAPPAVAPAMIFIAAAAIAVLLMLPAWRSMAEIWWENETYTHGMLVPLASLWLGWRERARLAGLAPRPAPLALLALGGCALGALAGEIAGVNTLRHAAAVGALPSLFVLCFGTAIARVLAFPLGFMVFAVPFGDFMLPWLIDRTADVTVAALQITGVPVLREGRQFVLPSGNWSVVEACSGLRYLLAAVPLALLQVHLNERTTRQRVIFVAAVVALALVANWVRAWGIVMLGHLSDMRLAAGVDHLIYGWLFFGIVMALAFWAEARMPDAPPPGREPAAVPSTAGPAGEAPRATLRLAALATAAVGLLAGAPLAAHTLQASVTPRLTIAKLQDALGHNANAAGDYRPGWRGARETAIGSAPDGAPAVLAAFHYYAQHAGTEMIGHGQGVLPPDDGNSRWIVTRTAPARASQLPTATGSDGALTEHEIARGDRRWLVWSWFWVDGRSHADPRRAKLATAAAMLSGRGDESVAFVAWTPLRDDHASARDRLAALIAAAVPAARAAGL
jgi:exosortase A